MFETSCRDVTYGKFSKATLDQSDHELPWYDTGIRIP